MTITPPPATRGELLSRARALSGHTVAELAARVGVDVPEDQRRAKGLVGQLAEWAVGATRGSAAGPDFPELGVELKTIPLSVRGTPRESTFVCTIDLRTIADSEWMSSALRAKLACVLWIPIEAEPTVRLADRRFGAPRLWELDGDDEAALRDDWETLVELIARDDLERVTARLGRYLQVRPKAASARERRRGVDRDQVPLRSAPRGFYLRRQFTARIFARP